MRIESPVSPSPAFLTAAFFLCALVAPGTLHAQASPTATSSLSFATRSQVAASYTYVRAASSAGGGGGFSLSGASATGAYIVRPHLSAVVDLGGTHINGINNSGLSLTLLTYLFGARYGLRPALHVSPFAQVLLGGVHATGSVYPPNNTTNGGADNFAMTLGVGADYPVNPTLSFRAQADYFLTALPNTGSSTQNNLRLAGGFVIHFGAR